MAKKIKMDAFLNDPTWYKDAVIYQVHVKSYFDANNDGVGDFSGLIDKLDYIASLGVNAIWLLPFYPSPMRDDGYDIADYRAVHPAYGSMADARRFIAEAHRRGLRVITEMVINHTSDQHAWFQKSRLAKKGSKARNVYVWSDTNQKYQGTRIIFSDTESSNWTWDPLAGQYFWHRFYSNQPDLNFDNPDVLKEVLNIMHFWFAIGVDGLRLDAIPYLVEREGTSNENLPETHQVLKAIRADLNAHYPDRMLLAEANLWPEDIQQYFGNGDECHMAFHFPLMPRMYMAIAQEDRFPIIDILRQMPEIPSNCQWAIFLRNHDELTLEMVTDQERDYLWNFYAADKRARINLGIRRRLAPLVERDRRRIELLNSLLLSMPGTPTLYYGDEIGMGDNIFLGDRHGVRTPMQWSDDRNGGFSRADPASLIAPTIMDPLYGFQAINVEAQTHDTHSLLNWTRRMLAVRKQQKAFGRGNLKMLAPANRRILAYLREYTSPEGTTEIILCVANMSRAAQAAELDLSSYNGKIPVEMIGGTSFPVISKLNYLLTLPPYGFYWFLLADESQMPSWYIAPVEKMPELSTLIIKQDLQELLQAPARNLLEKECLPAYLAKCPWYSSSGEAIAEVNLRSAIPFAEASDLMLLSEIEIHRQQTIERYYLPLGVVAEHLAGTPSLQLAVAHLRQKRTVGLLTDAMTLPEFRRGVIKNLRKHLVQPLADGELHYIPSPELNHFPEKSDEDFDSVSTIDANGSVVIDDTMLLKPIRKVIAGIHPEIEINSYLSEAGFTNIAPLLGEVRRVNAEAEQYTLMVLQGYISNQGDAWQWTQNSLERALRDRLSAGTSSMDVQYPAMVELEEGAQTLGNRLGELHCVLVKPTENLRFRPLQISSQDAVAAAQAMTLRFQQTLDILAQDKARESLWLISHSSKIIRLIKNLAADTAGSLAIRIHGNLHLGQVLIARSDAYFVNFEDAITAGSVSKVLPSADVKAMANSKAKSKKNKDAERYGHLKHSPLRDVADMICSFEDAAAAAMRNAQNTALPFQSEHIQDMAATYSRKARAAFYDSYSRATQKLPHKWLHSDAEANSLMVLRIDNRLREILKLSHKPDCLAIPIQGLYEMIKPLLEPPSGNRV